MEQIIRESVASKEDKKLADLLCKKDLDATASFQEIHSKRLLFISSKLCNASFNDEEAYDDMMDTYRWIVGQVQIKTNSERTIIITVTFMELENITHCIAQKR